MAAAPKRRRPLKHAGSAITRPRVLIVGERELRRDLVYQRLRESELAFACATDGEEAWSIFQESPFDLVVTGLKVPGLDGIGLVRRLRSASSRDPRVPVLLITAFGTLSLAAAAGRAGVTDCFSYDENGIEALTSRACSLIGTPEPTTPPALLGNSPAIAAARDRVRSLAGLNTPVLILGERGTAHAEVAAHLHTLGTLPGAPFHSIDCAIAADTITDIGAGTWYLIEVHDLSSNAQAAWRAVMRESQQRKDGRRSRIVASTTRDLKVLAGQKLFSAELARELSQFEVRLPPLRERRDDLPKLVEAILADVSARIGRPGIGISPRALDLLCACAWWENFPELEGVLESLAAFAPGLEITEAQAELVLVDSDPVARAARERARSEREQLMGLLDECGGNFTHMAERLKVDRGTIRYRLRKHGILPRAGSRGGP